MVNKLWFCLSEELLGLIEVFIVFTVAGEWSWFFRNIVVEVIKRFYIGRLFQVDELTLWKSDGVGSWHLLHWSIGFLGVVLRIANALHFLIYCGIFLIYLTRFFRRHDSNAFLSFRLPSPHRFMFLCNTIILLRIWFFFLLSVRPRCIHRPNFSPHLGCVLSPHLVLNSSFAFSINVESLHNCYPEIVHEFMLFFRAWVAVWFFRRTLLHINDPVSIVLEQLFVLSRHNVWQNIIRIP